MSSIHDNIRDTILKNDSITLKTHRLTDDVENYIRFTIEQILQKFNRQELLHTIYTIVKELAVNGCKANQKRIFFEEKNYDITDREQYIRGNQEYKKAISEMLSSELGLKARERGYYVLVDFQFSSDGIRLEITNNTAIAKQEEVILRDRLKKAMAFNDISEFYLANMDTMESGEGAGLGLALIVILMKAEGIDPNLLSILIKDDFTIARLEIPFTIDYVSMRAAQ